MKSHSNIFKVFGFFATFPRKPWFVSHVCLVLHLQLEHEKISHQQEVKKIIKCKDQIIEDLKQTNVQLQGHVSQGSASNVRDKAVFRTVILPFCLRLESWSIWLTKSSAVRILLLTDERRGVSASCKNWSGGVWRRWFSEQLCGGRQVFPRRPQTGPGSRQQGRQEKKEFRSRGKQTRSCDTLLLAFLCGHKISNALFVLQLCSRCGWSHRSFRRLKGARENAGSPLVTAAPPNAQSDPWTCRSPWTKTKT